MHSAPETLLSDSAQDALRELFNIAFGRAAASLAQIVDRRILLSPPRLYIYPAREVTTHLPIDFQDPLTHVRQAFQGAFHGEAHMVIRQEDLLHLLALTNHHDPNHEEILSSDIEAFAEIGNIILNAIIATFHLVTREHFQVTLPQAATLLPPLAANYPLPTWLTTPSVAILALANLEVAQEDIAFLLIVFLEIQALRSLVEALERLIPNNGSEIS